MCTRSLQSCLTLCNHVDCSLPDSSVHGFLQARILSGLLFLPAGHLPNPGIVLMSLNLSCIDYARAFEWITTNCGKFLKKWEYHLTCLLRKPAGQEPTEPFMGWQTGSKLGKEYVKAVYCYPAYLTYMESTSWKMPGWMKLKLELRLPGEIWIISDIQMTLT